MAITAVPEVLDISHVGQSGVAAKRLFDFLTSITSTLGSITSPFSYKGSIAVNTSFPLVAVVQTGDFYTVTADVTDNAGATYTNTGLVFLSGEEIVWNGTTWIRVGSALTNPLQYKGTITAAADFPAPTGSTGVKSGHVYLIAADVVDDDATKTNTSGVFTTGDSIQWNGTGWNRFTAQNTLQFRGSISSANEFPDPALVKTGHIYLVTDNVIDNTGTKTNTNMTFFAGDIIAWYSSSWKVLQRAANDVYAQAVGVDFITDESEVTGALIGLAANKFIPTHVIVKVVTVTGTPGTPAALNIGTSAGGTQIASGLAMTGLVLAGDTRVIPLSAMTLNLAGNATIYFNVETAEATATVLTCDVQLRGYQI